MKNYWEVLKAFEEGKTLKAKGSYLWNIKDNCEDNFCTELFDYNPDEWQIVKSDYERALESLKDLKLDLGLIAEKQIAELMVKFKNGEV